MQADIIISIALVTGVVLIINQFGRILRAFALHKTVREALSRDSNLTPELLERIEEKQPSGYTDDRNGLVLMAIGAAIIVFGILTGDVDDLGNMAGIAVFPLFVGAVLFGRHVWLKRRGAVS